ncbi:unnamed protein product [Blepharisma stoltei]|uniref:Uncharacterized protein n=1 Tax=Blepharisma stoltei TaxID=1481888 RepID=A0AAU9JFW2_9CILI|nr:unnamed protein product [Blepharisma stoltei]
MSLEPIFSTSYYDNKGTFAEKLQKDTYFYTRKLEHNRKQSDILNQELGEAQNKISMHKANQLSMSDSKSKMNSLINRAAWLENQLAYEQSKLNKTILENKLIKEKIEALRKEKQHIRKISHSSSQELERMRSTTEVMKIRNLYCKSETENVCGQIESSRENFMRSKSSMRSQILNLESYAAGKSLDASPAKPEMKRPKTPMELYSLHKHLAEKFGELGRGKYNEIDNFKKNKKTLITAFNEMRGQDFSWNEVVKIYLTYINQYNSLCKTLGDLSESIDKVSDEIKSTKQEILSQKSTAGEEIALYKLKCEDSKIKIASIEEEIAVKNEKTEKLKSKFSSILFPLSAISRWYNSLKKANPLHNEPNNVEMIFEYAKEADNLIGILEFLKIIKPKTEQNKEANKSTTRRTFKVGEIEGSNNGDEERPLSLKRFRAVAKEIAFKTN